jgi:signal peptidase I
MITASPLGEQQLLLTKGDNNPVDDIDLYQGLEWLERRNIVGKVRGSVLHIYYIYLSNRLTLRTFSFLPYVGYVTIAMVCCWRPP